MTFDTVPQVASRWTIGGTGGSCAAASRAGSSTAEPMERNPAATIVSLIRIPGAFLSYGAPPTGKALPFDLIGGDGEADVLRRHLGIAGTYSTTYYEPFHVARVFSTLDHMIGGRAAWNVVTSVNDSEAANFGHDAHLEHDARSDRADEFMEAVLGHWDTWEDDAIVYEREGGVFADPTKVHRLDHRGAWFRSRGPFTVPRTPQGRPGAR